MAPVFVDVSVANPEPPEVIVSPDGVLSATVHAAGGGVVLQADFTDYPSNPARPLEVLRTNVARPIEDPSQWGRGGGAMNTLSSEWAAHGTQSIKIVPAGSTTSAVYPYGTVAALNGMAPGRTYTASATIRLATEQTGDLHAWPRSIIVANVNGAGVVDLGYAISGPAPNVVGEHRVAVTFTVPEDSAGVFFRLMNGSSSTPVWWDGFMIEEGEEATGYFDGDTPDPDDQDPDSQSRPHYRWADGGRSEEYLPAVKAVDPPPWVRFERADGSGDWSPIFSGDPAAAPGGYGVAYDMFAPLNVAVTYRAVPILYGGTEGPPSQGVAVTLKAPAKWGNRRRIVWLKSARDPGLSMRVMATGDLPQFDREGRVNLQSVPNTPLPAGSSDVQTARSFSLEFRTEDQAEQERMEALLTSGTLLVQTPAAWQLRDMWVEPGTVSMAPRTRMDSGAHHWTVELSEVAQPSTADTPLIVPGRSWQWAADTYTWTSLDATFGSWRSVVNTSVSHR